MTILSYGPQGSQQSGSAVLLGYNPAPTASRLTASFGAFWTPTAKQDPVLRMPSPAAKQSDPAARAPWVKTAGLQRSSTQPWVLTTPQDDRRNSAWVKYLRDIGLTPQVSWGLAAAFDDRRNSVWQSFTRHSGIEPQAPWVKGLLVDIDRDNPWRQFSGRPTLMLHPSWVTARTVDGMQYVPWVRFSTLLDNGTGVVVPPDDGIDKALYAILPARFYMTAHTIYAQRLPDLMDIPLEGATASADEGSYCWSLDATGPASLFELLAPVAGLPAQLRLTLDGIDFVFAVKPSYNKSFGKTAVSVSGRSVTTLIGAPYQRATVRGNATARTAQQLALDALDLSGIDLDWGIGAGATANGGLIDWLIPAGAWSHSGTPLQAVQAIVESVGGYLQSHRSLPRLLARHPYGQRVGDAPGAPWSWMIGAADVELAPDSVITESITVEDGSEINGVYVSGTTTGVLALVRRTGSAGDKLAQMITDPLITHADAARQRGLAVLGASGNKYSVQLGLPVLTGDGQPGVLDVGQIVQINAAVPWRGRVRAVSVSAKQPTLRQSVTLVRHLEVA